MNIDSLVKSGPAAVKHWTPWNVFQQEFRAESPPKRGDNWQARASAAYQARKDTDMARWQAEADQRNEQVGASRPLSEEDRVKFVGRFPLKRFL